MYQYRVSFVAMYIIVITRIQNTWGGISTDDVKSTMGPEVASPCRLGWNIPSPLEALWGCLLDTHPDNMGVFKSLWLVS